MNPTRRRIALAALLSAVGCLSACGASLLPRPAETMVLHALDDAPLATAPIVRNTPNAAGPTLLVGTPRAAAGYDGTSIVYEVRAHERAAFASHAWVDTPARMLAPLIVQALERSGRYRAVLLAPAVAASTLRLDTELVRLQHDFTVRPSQARLTLRAVLIDTTTRQVLATQEFDTRVDSASEAPTGGVIAANQAVQQMLPALAAFCIAATPR